LYAEHVNWHKIYSETNFKPTETITYPGAAHQ